MRTFSVRTQGWVRFLTTILLVVPVSSAFAQQHEVGLSLGRVLSGERSAAEGSLDLRSGTALQANYAYRLIDGNAVALFADIHFLASPQRDVNSSIPRASTDFATIYLTPGVKVKFLPKARFSPFAVVGGGLAVYEHSELDNGGGPNGAPRTLKRGALTYGGGVDARMLSWLAIRGEFRNFYTGSPSLSPGLGSGGQNNTVLSGGIVIRFGS